MDQLKDLTSRQLILRYNNILKYKSPNTDIYFYESLNEIKEILHCRDQFIYTFYYVKNGVKKIYMFLKLDFSNKFKNKPLHPAYWRGFWVPSRVGWV